jgi:predicted component of type VI protein secretion system
MPAQLVSLGGGPSILLDKPILLIGRHPESDIQIESRKISRRHCCIAQVEDYLIIRDLGSTNGIRINGVRVLEGRLRAEDEVTIGASRFRVSNELVQTDSKPSHKSSRKRAEPSPEAVTPREEDAMQSCDEPIALADPRGRQKAVIARRATPRQVAAAARALVHRTPPPDVDVVPEEIGLAPSDSQDSIEQSGRRRSN